MASSIQALLRPRSVAHLRVWANAQKLAPALSPGVDERCAAAFLAAAPWGSASWRELHLDCCSLRGIAAVDRAPVLRL